jgi:hypothetical protein
MDVRSNHPLTAQRGIRNPRTLCPAEGRRGRVKKQVVKLYPIALNGPRLGGLTHGYTSWIAPAGDSASSACITEAG